MKKYILLPVITLIVTICNAQITFFACASSFTSSPNEYNFSMQGTDGTGRNFYQTNPIDGAQSCAAGVCEFRIAWSVANNRWEILLFQNQMDFSDAIVVYHNATAATPNPPSLNLGQWIDTTNSCGGTLSSSNATLTGDVQDTVLSINDKILVNNNIQIYPNPASKEFVVISKGESVKQIELFSALGKSILKQENPETINVSALAKGMYLLRVLTSSNQIVQRKVLVN